MLAMSTELIWQTISTGSEDTTRLGEILGANLLGGETIELVSDLGGGKTTFVKGLARGAGSQDSVSSPTFTISRIYKCSGGGEIHHFDFYRLGEPGIIADQLKESLADQKVVVVVEWSEIVKEVLPANHIIIKFEATPNNSEERRVSINYPEKYEGMIKKIETAWAESRP